MDSEPLGRQSRRSVQNLPAALSKCGEEIVDPPNVHRILIVDDERDTADSLARLLAIIGHETLTAYDGREAVMIAKSFRPEIVILDIEMPVQNGYDACRQIRAETWGQQMVLIALTGRSGEENRRRSKEVGFNHHLVKGVDLDALKVLLDR